MTPSGITFIYSNVTFENADLPFSISESMTLRAAEKNEIELFNKHLEETYGKLSQTIVPFDQEPKEINNGETSKTIYIPSQYRRWWVIEFNGYNPQILDLEKVATLINPKLKFGVTFLYRGPNLSGSQSGSMFGGDAIFRILSEEARKKYQKVETKELHRLKSYYENFCSPDGTLKNFKYSLDLFNESSYLWIHSPLLTLSLFSIIESLTAHKPRLTETLDSITHQLKHKINLLSRRFDLKLEYKMYFGEINPQKVWSKLYAIRSDIAHGQPLNFDNKNICLKDIENVNLFLNSVVRELIKLSIAEPELVKDIQEC